MIVPNPTSIIRRVKSERNINAPTLPWIICEQFVIHIIQAAGTKTLQRIVRMSITKVIAVSNIVKSEQSLWYIFIQSKLSRLTLKLTLTDKSAVK